MNKDLKDKIDRLIDKIDKELQEYSDQRIKNIKELNKTINEIDELSYELGAVESNFKDLLKKQFSKLAEEKLLRFPGYWEFEKHRDGSEEHYFSLSRNFTGSFQEVFSNIGRYCITIEVNNYCGCLYDYNLCRFTFRNFIEAITFILDYDIKISSSQLIESEMNLAENKLKCINTYLNKGE